LLRLLFIVILATLGLVVAIRKINKEDSIIVVVEEPHFGGQLDKFEEEE